ncbi:MAG TPA: glycosyltransferase, partial [Candidatus Omnitrophota bacterium]|nr:glycosyltransferase [Candidatus Omnitrophota bacterium]
MDISVIVPVFNEESNLLVLHERLVNVITGITNQYEIIFVNDGSKDNSLTVIKTLAQQFPQIKYID